MNQENHVDDQQTVKEEQDQDESIEQQYDVSPKNWLPDDMLFVIFSFLYPSHLCKLSLVCRRFNHQIMLHWWSFYREKIIGPAIEAGASKSKKKRRVAAANNNKNHDEELVDEHLKRGQQDKQLLIQFLTPPKYNERQFFEDIFSICTCIVSGKFNFHTFSIEVTRVIYCHTLMKESGFFAKAGSKSKVGKYRMLELYAGRGTLFHKATECIYVITNNLSLSKNQLRVGDRFFVLYEFTDMASFEASVLNEVLKKHVADTIQREKDEQKLREEQLELMRARQAQEMKEAILLVQSSPGGNDDGDRKLQKLKQKHLQQLQKLMTLRLNSDTFDTIVVNEGYFPDYFIYRRSMNCPTHTYLRLGYSSSFLYPNQIGHNAGVPNRHGYMIHLNAEHNVIQFYHTFNNNLCGLEYHSSSSSNDNTGLLDLDFLQMDKCTTADLLKKYKGELLYYENDRIVFNDLPYWFS